MTAKIAPNGGRGIAGPGTNAGPAAGDRVASQDKRHLEKDVLISNADMIEDPPAIVIDPIDCPVPTSGAADIAKIATIITGQRSSVRCRPLP